MTSKLHATRGCTDISHLDEETKALIVEKTLTMNDLIEEMGKLKASRVDVIADLDEALKMLDDLTIDDYDHRLPHHRRQAAKLRTLAAALRAGIAALEGR